MGSPPRMREIPCIASTCSISDRITPAYAGNTDGSGTYCLYDRDHPRVCGKYWCAHNIPYFVWGSPPRMREIRCEVEKLIAGIRITPAYAGNTLESLKPFLSPWGSPPRMREIPWRKGRFLVVLGDHPRVCGKYLTQTLKRQLV